MREETKTKLLQTVTEIILIIERLNKILGPTYKIA